MTGTSSGRGTSYPSGTYEFTPVFSGVHAAQSLVFYVQCDVDNFLAIVFSVLFEITLIDCLFGIFNILLVHTTHFWNNHKVHSKSKVL
jgi:hypothetical protein